MVVRDFLIFIKSVKYKFINLPLYLKYLNNKILDIFLYKF